MPYLLILLFETSSPILLLQVKEGFSIATYVANEKYFPVLDC